MKLKKLYTKYEYTDGKFNITAKVSPEWVTLINLGFIGQNANNRNQFLFRKSTPAMMMNFSKAMKALAKLSKEMKDGE